VKKLILIILVLFAFKAYPQGFYFYNPSQWLETDTTVDFFSMINFYSGQNQSEKKTVVKNNIREWSTQSYSIRRIGDTSLSWRSVKTFDKHGNQISSKNFDKKNRICRSEYFLYNDSSKILSDISINRKGTIIRRDSATYNSEGRQTSEMNYRIGGIKIKYKTNTAYNDRGQITEISSFKYRKSLKEISWGKYITIYNEDGTKGETEWYNGKGKLISTWSFTCDPTGSVKKSKGPDSTNVCISYDYGADGSKIKTMIYTDRKKHITKSVLKYDPKGNLSEYFFYNRQNKITSRYSYTYNTDKNITSYIRYRRGGVKISRKCDMEYNSSKLCTKYTMYHRNKLFYTYVYNYNEKGLQTSTISYNNEGRKTWFSKNSYEFY
jgi:hypothetical protein